MTITKDCKFTFIDKYTEEEKRQILKRNRLTSDDKYLLFKIKELRKKLFKDKI